MGKTETTKKHRLSSLKRFAKLQEKLAQRHEALVKRGEEVEREVERTEEDIRRGARRTDHRFRL